MKTPLVVEQSAEELVEVIGGCWDPNPLVPIDGDPIDIVKTIDPKEFTQIH